MTHRILIVDDEAHILQVLSLKLRRCGYEIATACDGEDALRQALEIPPDLVITDVQMPYMNGIELSHALLDSDKTSHIPVVVLTARGHALDSFDTNITSVRKVLGKPFSPRGIAELAAQILADVPEREAEVRNSEAA